MGVNVVKIHVGQCERISKKKNIKVKLGLASWLVTMLAEDQCLVLST